MATKIVPGEVIDLDPYTFMAVIGKRVIHPGRRASTQALLRRAQITGPDRVLDVGCGVATTAIEIARRHGALVTAVDVAPLMLDRARANARDAGLDGLVAVEEGDILGLRFPGDSFDVVIAEAVTMFVDRRRAAAELARAGAGHRVLLRTPPTAEVKEIFLGQVCLGLEFDTVEDWVALYASAGLEGLETGTGPFEMLTPRGFLADEGPAGCLAIMARVAARPAHMRKMAWLMPRMARAVPYLGHIVVVGTKPR